MCQHGWAHRWQTSLIQAYKNLFPDMTNTSVTAVTTLRTSLSMYALYVFFVYNNLFLIACFVNSSQEVTFIIALVLLWLQLLLVQQGDIIYICSISDWLLLRWIAGMGNGCSWATASFRRIKETLYSASHCGYKPWESHRYDSYCYLL
jgi:hypothetical protein